MYGQSSMFKRDTIFGKKMESVYFPEMCTFSHCVPNTYSVLTKLILCMSERSWAGKLFITIFNNGQISYFKSAEIPSKIMESEFSDNVHIYSRVKYIAPLGSSCVKINYSYIKWISVISFTR